MIPNYLVKQLTPEELKKRILDEIDQNEEGHDVQQNKTIPDPLIQEAGWTI
jgi:hypothetical protein